jgi:arsenate reductase
MAEGFARYYAKDRIEVFSAGSHPSGKVDPDAIEVMKEKEIDISKQISKGFLNLPHKNFDYLVTMGCEDICPFVPAEKTIHWQIPDPKGKPIEIFREVRDQIKRQVIKLIDTVEKAKEQYGKTF